MVVRSASSIRTREVRAAPMVREAMTVLGRHFCIFSGVSKFERSIKFDCT